VPKRLFASLLIELHSVLGSRGSGADGAL